MKTILIWILQIRELLMQLDEEDFELDSESKTKKESGTGFADFEEMNRKIYFDEVETKPYTKRPAVDKLDPKRLNAVMIFSSLPFENFRSF